MGVIEPHANGGASPIDFFSKKDRTFRSCVDDRKLNLVTIQDHYQMPRMAECIDSLGEATIFSIWTLPADNENSKLSKKIGIKQPPHSMMVFSVLLTCPLDSKMRHGRFNER